MAVFGYYYWYQDNAFVFVTPPYNHQFTIVDAQLDVETTLFKVKTRLLKTTDLIATDEAKQNDPAPFIVKKIEKTANTIKLYTQDAIIRLKK